ncbi:MAG: hypothetical protein ACI4WS_05900 [Oscillospiraceae bacterium]
MNVVKTSDPANIPSARPDAYNMLDGIYEWKYDHISEDYVVGTTPELITSEKYVEYYGQLPEETAKQKDKRLSKLVEEYNKYADAIYTAFAQYMGKYDVSTEYDDWTSNVIFKITDGEWSCSSSYNYYFTKDIVRGDIEEAVEFLSSKVTGLDEALIAVFFKDGKLCGAAVTDRSGDLYFNPTEFSIGYTNAWSYIDGVQYDRTYGTYPVLKRLSADSYGDAAKLFKGTWKNDEHTLTINDSTFEADKITGFSIYSDSVTMTYKESGIHQIYYSTDMSTYLTVEEYYDGYREEYETYYSPAEYIRRH